MAVTRPNTFTHGAADTLAENALARRLKSYRFEAEPMKRGITAITDSIVETGRLPGAPAAHQKLADVVEYAQAIVSSTTTVAEAITPQDLKYFAWGLPVLSGSRPLDAELDARDINNLIALNKCLPEADIGAGNYHVSGSFHTGKLMLIAALNPRAIEWLFLAAVMSQRGLYNKVIELLVERKDRFLEIMHKDLASQENRLGIDRAIIAFDATLDRVIVNVVTSLKSLDLGILGPELELDEDVLPDLLDLDCYVTADHATYSIAKEAQNLGCQFHDEIMLVEPSPAATSGGKRRMLSKGPTLQLSESSTNRLRRIEVLRNTPGSSRYHIRNAGPTGRVPHARLIAGVIDRLLSSGLPPAQRQKLRTALVQSSAIGFNLEVDLATGVANILKDQDNFKGMVKVPELNLDSDLPEPARLGSLTDIPDLSELQNAGFLQFDHVAAAMSNTWNSVVVVYLIVRGWWWSKHLIRNLPDLLFVPSHAAYFNAMARIGTIMELLEQNSTCEISVNLLFDALRLLTNLGGTHDPITHEAAVYAAQGPGGTLVQDILGEHSKTWEKNYCLAFRWLQGKFYGVPETALFAHGCEWRKTIPTPNMSDDSEPAVLQTNTSVTIFADSTDGHTLSCAIVTRSRKIRVLPFCRVLCGVMTAYPTFAETCRHETEDINQFMKKEHPQLLPWSVIEDKYYGRAEVMEEDSVLVTTVDESKLCQIMALAVMKEGSAVALNSCELCGFSLSKHVIRARTEEV